MKICPVCNDTFADQLNFCDVDGVRLTQAGGGQDRSKWWSLLGAGLLIGALVISAASIFFLPRSRVPAPTVSSSEPAPSPSVTPKPPTPESTASVATPVASGEPETAAPEALVPEVKKKEKTLSNSNSSGAIPNPKAAALAAEEGDKKPVTGDATTPALAPKKPEQPVKTVSDSHPVDASTNAPPDPKKDPKAQTASTKNQEKDSKDKKKEDEKKKGGFLKVFKKIFGKD